MRPVNSSLEYFSINISKLERVIVPVAKKVTKNKRLIGDAGIDRPSKLKDKIERTIRISFLFPIFDWMWGSRKDTKRTMIEPTVYQIPGFVFKKFVSIKVELKYAVLERIIENKNPEIRNGSIERIVLFIVLIITSSFLLVILFCRGISLLVIDK